MIFLKSVLGQGKALSFLHRSFSRRQMAHAYLLRGPAGVGKVMAAKAFAAYINCLAPEGEDSCGKCSSCLKFASDNHPDLLKLEPEGDHLKIDQIRQLQKELSYPPFEAGFRVVLIADIHRVMRRREVANSLLKTLEEPPAQTIFFLTGDEDGTILPTIISRCQVVPFAHLAPGEIIAVLTGQGMAEAEARPLAMVAEGSVGRAFLFADLDLLTMGRALLDKVLDSTSGEGKRVPALLAMAEDMASLQDQLQEMLDLLAVWLRDGLMVAQGLADRVVSEDFAPLYARMVDQWQVEGLLSRLDALAMARSQLGRNCNRAMVCEVLLLEMAR